MAARPAYYLKKMDGVLCGRGMVESLTSFSTWREICLWGHNGEELGWGNNRIRLRQKKNEILI